MLRLQNSQLFTRLYSGRASRVFTTRSSASCLFRASGAKDRFHWTASPSRPKAFARHALALHKGRDIRGRRHRREKSVALESSEHFQLYTNASHRVPAFVEENGKVSRRGLKRGSQIRAGCKKEARTPSSYYNALSFHISKPAAPKNVERICPEAKNAKHTCANQQRPQRKGKQK